MLRVLLASALLAGCAADEPPPADPQAIVAAVDHAQLELERSRGTVAQPAEASAR